MWLLFSLWNTTGEAAEKSSSSISSGLSPTREYSECGRGIGRTKKKPMTMGIDVPIARTSRNSDVSPGNMTCAIVENRNADRPNPEMTRPTTVAR